MSKVDVQRRIFDALEMFGADPDAIHSGATFEDLDIDSLDIVEMVQIIDDEYGVELTDDDAEGLETVGDVVTLVASRLP